MGKIANFELPYVRWRRGVGSWRQLNGFPSPKFPFVIIILSSVAHTISILRRHIVRISVTLRINDERCKYTGWFRVLQGMVIGSIGQTNSMGREGLAIKIPVGCRRILYRRPGVCFRSSISYRLQVLARVASSHSTLLADPVDPSYDQNTTPVNTCIV